MALTVSSPLADPAPYPAHLHRPTTCSNLTAYSGPGSSFMGKPKRTYFISADEVMWNYAPSGRNL